MQIDKTKLLEGLSELAKDLDIPHPDLEIILKSAGLQFFIIIGQSQNAQEALQLLKNAEINMNSDIRTLKIKNIMKRTFQSAKHKIQA